MVHVRRRSTIAPSQFAQRIATAGALQALAGLAIDHDGPLDDPVDEPVLDAAPAGVVAREVADKRLAHSYAGGLAKGSGLTTSIRHFAFLSSPAAFSLLASSATYLENSTCHILPLRGVFADALRVGSAPPAKTDSAIPRMLLRYSVSSMAAHSSSPMRTAPLPLLFVMVTGAQFSLTLEMRL